LVVARQFKGTNSSLCYFQRDNNAMKIFVGGIANGTTEEDLRNYFSAYGTVNTSHFVHV